MSGIRHSPRFPTLPANLGEHTCCLYAFSPIPSTESNSDIPFLIASISAPSPQTKSAYWGCLRKTCPNLDFPCFATCAPRKHPKLTRDMYQRTKVTLRSDLWAFGGSQEPQSIQKFRRSQNESAPDPILESRTPGRTALPRSLLNRRLSSVPSGGMSPTCGWRRNRANPR